MVEALLFAAAEPLDEESIVQRLPGRPDVKPLLDELRQIYARRGVNLVLRAGKWMFQTAPDLAFLLQQEVEEEKRLSRAAQETLAIIAYHQPTTRAEIEDIRGVTVSKGTVDVLMETGWVRIMGRRQTPGKPVTYGVTDQFLIQFGLESVKDLPGLDELKAAGLLDAEPPEHFRMVPGDAGEEPEEEDAELPFDDPVPLRGS
ncbi:MAG: SMC-Scp complex subunit ScpB [Alphaproteobacteria bacterium]|nr:SMC-Scp complex subunit ScpB [Alphaproteobacteria bacterium]